MSTNGILEGGTQGTIMGNLSHNWVALSLICRPFVSQRIFFSLTERNNCPSLNMVYCLDKKYQRKFHSVKWRNFLIFTWISWTVVPGTYLPLLLSIMALNSIFSPGTYPVLSSQTSAMIPDRGIEIDCRIGTYQIRIPISELYHLKTCKLFMDIFETLHSLGNLGWLRLWHWTRWDQVWRLLNLVLWWRLSCCTGCCPIFLRRNLEYRAEE